MLIWQVSSLNILSFPLLWVPSLQTFICDCPAQVHIFCSFLLADNFWEKYWWRMIVMCVMLHSSRRYWRNTRYYKCECLGLWKSISQQRGYFLPLWLHATIFLWWSLCIQKFIVMALANFPEVFVPCFKSLLESQEITAGRSLDLGPGKSTAKSLLYFSTTYGTSRIFDLSRLILIYKVRTTAKKPLNFS